MKAMQSLSTENIGRLEKVLKEVRQWNPPRTLPPPSLPGFEERLVVFVGVSSRCVKVDLAVTPGREFLFDEGKKIVYEVPEDQQQALRDLLATKEKKNKSR